MGLPIEVDRDTIADVCRRHGMVWLAFFGSVIHDDFGPDSNVDVLVRFGPARVPGLLALAEMQFELADVLGHKADRRTPEDLSEHFRHSAVAEAVTQYVA
jgi:predicted nucleotidyltransferase